MLAGPTPDEPDPSIVTPGVPGFLVFVLLAVIVALLVLSMSRHLRRVDARAAAEEREAQARAAEDDARATADDAETPDDAASPAVEDRDGGAGGSSSDASSDVGDRREDDRG